MDMSPTLTTCPLCGHRFSPDERGHCHGCPLVKGCGTTCCPACGYVDVDPQRTAIGRWFAARRRRPGSRPMRWEGGDGARVTLADVPAGCLARIVAIEGAPSSRRQQLRAYGLRAGDWVRVVQHVPVTVAVVEHTELALETDLARCILVDAFEPWVPPSAQPRR